MLVPLAALESEDELLHLAANGRPFRRQEGQPPANHFVDQEKIQLSAELAMITFGRLLQHLEVRLELLLRRERRPVDAGQLLVLLAALPVGAGNREQAEGTQLTGSRDMRAQTEVDEVAGSIEAGGRVRDLVTDQFHLERLVQPLEEGHRLRPGDLLLHEGRRGLDDLAHARLDLRQVLGLEPLFEAEVVVEALIRRGSDTDHRARKEVEDCRRHHVRGRVTEDF